MDKRAAGGLLQLRQPQRSRQSRRTAADDQHIDVEGLSLSHHGTSTQRRRDAETISFLKTSNLRASASLR